MKKLNLKGLSEVLSEKELKQVVGGSTARGSATICTGKTTCKSSSDCSSSQTCVSSGGYHCCF